MHHDMCNEPRWQQMKTVVRLKRHVNDDQSNMEDGDWMERHRIPTIESSVHILLGPEPSDTICYSIGSIQSDTWGDRWMVTDPTNCCSSSGSGRGGIGEDHVLASYVCFLGPVTACPLTV